MKTRQVVSSHQCLFFKLQSYMSMLQQKNWGSAKALEENHMNMKGKQSLQQIISQQSKPSDVRQKIERQQKLETYTPSPAYLKMKSSTSEFLKKIERLQAENPQQGIDYNKYSKNFKNLSLDEMDKTINILKRVCAKGLPQALRPDVTLKVQIKLLSQIRSEARNILSIIKRAAKSIFKCFPTYRSSKDLKIQLQDTESSNNLSDGDSNLDSEEKEKLIKK